MRTSTLIRIAIVVSILSASLQAGVVPGRWEKVDALAAGEGIIVRLKSGERLEGVFGASHPEGIELTTIAGDRLNLEKTAITKIVRAKKHQDPTTNGAIIGTGVGFGVGFGSLVAANAQSTASGPIFDSESMAIYTVGALVGAGIGALVGAAIDAVHMENEVLYRAP